MPPKHDTCFQGESSSSAAALNLGPNLPFISSEIGRVSKLDIAICTPDGFEIWKQCCDSAVTTGFFHLPPETQRALFTNILSDDTVKRMNNIGHQQKSML